MTQRTRAPGAEKPPPRGPQPHGPQQRPPMPRRSAWALAAALVGLTFLADLLVRSLS